MPGDAKQPITQLLQEAAAGNRLAENALLEHVYDQLRVIARERMKHERAGHTLQATALVNEALVRLIPSAKQDGSAFTWRDRAHFYRAAAEAMRRILIDHARQRGRQKRGGSVKRDVMNVCDLAALDDSDEILALDDVISRLQGEDGFAAEIVRLRFFAGLTVEQTAEALGVSPRTVKREWAYARARLFHLLEEREQEHDG